MPASPTSLFKSKDRAFNFWIHRTGTEEILHMGFPGCAGNKKNPPANAGDVRGTGSIPGLGRSPRGGQGNPFQYSCQENPMDRVA